MRSVISCLLVPALAVPTDAATAGTDDAKGHQNRGFVPLDLQAFEPALASFEAAYSLEPDAATLFNIARCQHKLKRTDAALESFRTLLRKFPSAPNRDEARAQIEELEG